jgi:uncharacterized protein (TIGR00255 family)
MIISMTGFARNEAQTDNGSMVWELRSVNHRYLDIQLRLPDGFRHAEQTLREVIKSQLARGKVDATLTVHRRQDESSGMRLNLTLARELIGHIDTLAEELGKPAEVNPASLLRWPGVLEEEKTDPGEQIPIALKSLEEAVDELRESRRREGAKVKEMLSSRCADIEKIVSQVTGRLPEVLIAINQRMTERVRALGVEPDKERLEQELAIIAQKLDVSEELDRIRAHIGEIRDSFNNYKPVGRRLDFLMQELNREANTLGSKSADSNTTQQAVELKVLIEQMREQVQNVE